MPFSSQDIRRRLQEQLHLSPEEAEDVLSGFVHYVRDTLSSEGRARVPHVGTFAHDGYDISYEPEESLLAAVNERYAGLERETLYSGPPPEEPSAAPAPPEETLDVSPPPEETLDTGPPSEETLDASPLEEAAPEPHEDEEDWSAQEEDWESTEETVASLFRKAQEADDADRENEDTRRNWSLPRSHEPEEDEEEHSGASTAAAAIAADAARGRPEPESDVPPIPPSSSTASSRKRKRSFLPLTILVVLLLGAGAWLTWQFTQGNMDSPLADNPGVDMMPRSPGSPFTDTTETEMEAAPDTAATASEPPAPEPPALNPAEGGYSLIVLSTPDAEVAEERANGYASQLSEQDIPAGVLEADVNGTTWYRVAVGQFSSVSEAQSVLADLSGDIPPDAWIVEL